MTLQLLTVDLMCMNMASMVIVAENSVCTVNDAAGRIVWAEGPISLMAQDTLVSAL